MPGQVGSSKIRNSLRIGNSRPNLMSFRSAQLKLASGSALVLALLTGCATTSGRGSASWPRFALETARTWQLNSPDGERFDASGLFLAPNGDLLTVNDRGPSVYQIQFSPDATAAD